MGKRQVSLASRLISFLRDTFRLIAGICLLPAAGAACYATSILLYESIRDRNFSVPLLCGAVLYAAIAFLGRNRKNSSNAVYVFAHELSHALAAISFGAKVFRIKVNRQSGSVRLSKSNFIIGLAPYFMPLYALMAALAYIAAAHFFPQHNLKPWFSAAAGFFLTFHFVHTIGILSGPMQPDIQEEGGMMFSFPVIIFFSCISSLAIIIIMSESVRNAHEILIIFIQYQKIFYIKSYYLLKYIYNFIFKFVSG